MNKMCDNEYKIIVVVSVIFQDFCFVVKGRYAKLLPQETLFLSTLNIFRRKRRT